MARLATVRPDGGPHLVPIAFAVDRDTVVSVVDAKPKRSAALQRLANVRHERRVSLLVDRYEDDWRRLWWVRADGVAEVVASGPDHARAVDLLSAKYARYRRERPTGPVLRVGVLTWRWWSFA